MALVNLFIKQFGFDRRRTTIEHAIGDGSKTALLSLDALTSEKFSVGSEITQHPVEGDADISDHVILRPKKLMLEGVFSETPYEFLQSLSGLTSSAGALLGQKALGSLGSFGGAVAGGYAAKSVAGLLSDENNTENRVDKAITELIAARDARAPVVIVTGMRRYPSEPNSFYFLEGAEFTREQGTGRAVRVSLSFIEVLKVNSEVALLEFPKEVTGAKKQNGGRQGMQPQSEEKQRASSIALGLFRAAVN